jgi:O-antigen ligase
LTVPTLLLLTYLPVGALFKRMPILWFLLIYLVWVLAGLRVSPLGVGPFLTSWLTDLDYLAVAILALHLVTTQRRLWGLVDTLLLGGTFVSVFGLYGYFTGQNGVVDPTTSVFRIYSTFSAPPSLALFLSVVIPLALYRALTLRGWRQAGMWLLLLLFAITTLLTFSRGALISIPLSILILILFLPSGESKFTLLASMGGLAIGILIVTWVAGIPIFGRFLSEDVTTFNGRTIVWQSLLNYFDPKQLLGKGLGASNDLLSNLPVADIANAPSNLFLGTLYDHGIIGLGLLLVMLIALAISIVKGIGRTKGEQRMLFVVGLVVLGSVFLQLFEQDDFWSNEIGVYFWIIMALPLSRCWDNVEKVVDEDDDEQPTDPQIEVPWWMRKQDAIERMRNSGIEI